MQLGILVLLVVVIAEGIGTDLFSCWLGIALHDHVSAPSAMLQPKQLVIVLSPLLYARLEYSGALCLLQIDTNRIGCIRQ